MKIIWVDYKIGFLTGD